MPPKIFMPIGILLRSVEPVDPAPIYREIELLLVAKGLEGFQGQLYVLVLVARRGHHAELDVVLGDDGIHDARDEDSLVAEEAYPVHRHARVPAAREEYGHDGRLDLADAETQLAQAGGQAAGHLEEPFTPRRAVLDELESLLEALDVDHRQGLGEDLGARVVLDPLDDVLPRRGDAADRREGLGEGAEVDVDPVRHAEVLGAASARGAHDAEAVGVVYHEPGLVPVLYFADRVELGEVAGHAIDALGDHEDALLPCLVDVREQLLEALHVVVPEDPQVAPRLGRSDRGVDDRGVVELVHYDDIVGADEGADSADDAQVTVIEEDRGFLAREAGEGVLEGEVLRGIAAHHSGAHRSARSPGLQSRAGGRLDLLALRESEVVVDRP